MTERTGSSTSPAQPKARTSRDGSSHERSPGISTVAVHAGEDRVKPEDALTTPIYQTSTYTFRETRELCAYMEGEVERYEYGRYGNPTCRAAERKLAALEGAQEGLLFGSGMAAITTALLAILSRGHHVVMTHDCYRRTRQFCSTILPKFGIDVATVDTCDYAALEAAIGPNTRVIVSESPTNPYLHVLDLKRLVEIARANGLKVIIDSTFATPYNQRPLELGADLVVHAATKYLGGHNDLLAGAVLGGPDLVGAIRDVQAILGGVADPHSAYLLIRGLKTFPLRIERQNATGMRVAEWLEGQKRVRRVHYPGLPSHPHHQIARAQMRGFGGVVSFEIDGDLEAGSRFVDAVRIPAIAPSFGGVETLIEQPALMSYYELSSEERSALGITDSLIRLSLGVEDADDIIADLAAALDGQ